MKKYFIYLSIIFVGIYVLDWGVGLNHELLDLLWLLLSTAISIFIIFFLVKPKKNKSVLLGSFFLVALFFSGLFGFGDIVKNITLGEVVIYMEGAFTPSSDIVKIRKKGDNYHAYFSSSFFISTSYSRYKVNIIKHGQFELVNNDKTIIFNCVGGSCESKLGSFSVYVDKLFKLRTSA